MKHNSISLLLLILMEAGCGESVPIPRLYLGARSSVQPISSHHQDERDLAARLQILEEKPCGILFNLPCLTSV